MLVKFAVARTGRFRSKKFAVLGEPHCKTPPVVRSLALTVEDKPRWCPFPDRSLTTEVVISSNPYSAIVVAVV
jgi:hypothetical protein